MFVLDFFSDLFNGICKKLNFFGLVFLFFSDLVDLEFKFVVFSNCFVVRVDGLVEGGFQSRDFTFEGHDFGFVFF